MDEPGMRRVRGRDISMIFQEPMTALNPVFTIGDQINEALATHTGMPRKKRRAHCLELLHNVRIADAAAIYDEYPHRLSGGMRQRVMIAMAIACGPKLLIADEPTTALDVTIQAQVLELLRDLKHSLDMAMLLITHDLGVVAENADRVGVMYAGCLVEAAPVGELFSHPLHPYTQGLMLASPKVAGNAHFRSAPLHEIPGNVPSLANLPQGCPFAPRCEKRMERCDNERPTLSPNNSEHSVACFAHTSSSATEMPL
jgi:oligopeptide/dipeptide ABC transporter ATP-binding protein